MQSIHLFIGNSYLNNLFSADGRNTGLPETEKAPEALVRFKWSGLRRCGPDVFLSTAWNTISKKAPNEKVGMITISNPNNILSRNQSAGIAGWDLQTDIPATGYSSVRLTGKEQQNE